MDGDPTTPWAAVPEPDHSFRKEMFSNIQPEPPLVKLEAITFPLHVVPDVDSSPLKKYNPLSTREALHTLSQSFLA